MSLPVHAPVHRLVSFPRVSGDEPPVDAVRADMSTFSPRERG